MIQVGIFFQFPWLLNKNVYTKFYPTFRSLYRHVECNVPVSCKAFGDRNQLGAWLDNDLIATNHRVVAAQRQQPGLVAVTIRGSVLFYSSAIWKPDFLSVKTEFRYLYGVDSIELRTLFYLWKMCPDHHWHWKNTKSKSESRRCQFCWYLTCILTIKLRDIFDHQELER